MRTLDFWSLQSNIFAKQKVRETVIAYLNGAQVESFKPPKNGQKSRDTVPFRFQDNLEHF